MITFDNVTKYYNGNIGLENASLDIEKGDFVFLVGPSGAGKSTFIKLILREIEADSGSIIVDGMEVTKLSNREIPVLRRKIGIVFQDFRLLPKKTVYENVAFAMEAGVDLILSAIDAGEKICIYGDYDADGITSTSIMSYDAPYLVIDGSDNRRFNGSHIHLRRTIQAGR